MPILTKTERKHLIDRICSRFHKDGIKRLSEIGNFEKYTPLYHFRISEPIDDGDFIFITDLFGDMDVHPALMSGYRMQRHGNFNGLSRSLVLGAYNDMKYSPFVSYLDIYSVTDEERVKFDKSLKYIDNVMGATTPETRKLDIGSEVFSSTYYVI